MRKNKCDEADTQWEDRRKDSVENDGSYSFAPTSLSFVDDCSTRTFTSGFAKCSQMCFFRFTEVPPYARKNRPYWPEMWKPLRCTVSNFMTT